MLFAVRSLPERVSGKRGLSAEKDEPLLEQMPDSGFVRLAEEPGREIVFGGVGQMFEPRGGTTPAIGDAREFVALREPGYAKVAMNFSAEPVGGADGGLTRLATETRVLTTDADSRRKFGSYRRLIRPGSAARASGQPYGSRRRGV